jgi:hypothetical protein
MSNLTSKFEIEDEGVIDDYLGVKIEKGTETGTATFTTSLDRFHTGGPAVAQSRANGVQVSQYTCHLRQQVSPEL